MSKRLSIILVFFAVLFSFCTATKEIAAKETYIKLEETPIQTSQLPSSFKVFPNGKFIYQEKGGIKNEGFIEQSENTILWDMVAKAKLFELKDSYMTGAEDTPPSIVTYFKDNEIKEISFQVRAPEQLKKMVAKLKKIRRQSVS